MNLLALSWKNLTNKPLSMLLSLVLFALGVGLISLLLVLNKQLQEKFDKNLAGIDLVIGAKGSPLQLILCSMYHIDNPTGNISIKEARPFMREGHPLIKRAVPLSLGDNHQGYRVVGTTSEIIDLYEAEIGEGKFWDELMEVTLGASVALDLNMKIGDKFYGSHGLIKDDELLHDDAEAFEVVGILKPTGSVIDQLILTKTQSVWAVHEHAATEEGGEHDHHSQDTIPLIDRVDQDITSLLVQFRNRNFQTLNLPRNINENTEMQAATPAIEINRLYSMMGVGADALRILAIVIIIVSGLSIFISLFSSLKERKYELALMRVMGSSPVKLFFLVLLEGIVLAILGYGIGMVLSHGGMELLSGFMKDSYRYSFSGLVFLQDEIFLFFGAIGIGIVAALIPAFQAMNTDISTTLAEN